MRQIWRDFVTCFGFPLALILFPVGLCIAGWEWVRERLSGE